MKRIRMERFAKLAGQLGLDREQFGNGTVYRLNDGRMISETKDGDGWVWREWSEL